MRGKDFTVKVIDLFCGVGGLTYGLQKEGLDVVAGIDNDPSCKFAYEHNNKAIFIEADIAELPAEHINYLYKGADIKVLIGCAPCQTFSQHTKKYKNRVNDKKWNLLRSFTKYINQLNPDIISMENVPGLIKFDIFKEFKENLYKKGYHISYQVVKCDKYGLPQKRRRLVLLASKLGEINLINPPNKKRTVRDVLEKLPPLNSGCASKKDPLHKCSGLTDINIERMKQSIPGGTWRDWDKDLVLDCHKKTTGQSYSSVYGRMKWDDASPTITTQFYAFGTGRFGHPEQNRALSVREGALLQTFPKHYKFFKDEKNIPIVTISRHIGNAVPVDLAKIIGKSINQHLDEVKQ